MCLWLLFSFSLKNVKSGKILGGGVFGLGVIFGINLYLCSGLQSRFKAWHVKYSEQKKVLVSIIEKAIPPIRLKTGIEVNIEL